MYQEQDKFKANGRKKNCVIVASGKNSLHKIYTDCERNYDVVILAYEDCESYGAEYIRKDGFKYHLIYEYLQDHNQYDRYLFIDDDVLITNKEIETIFDLSEKYKCKIFHPAINTKNYDHTTLMHKIDNTKLHTQTWCEIMCLGMDRETVIELLPTFKATQSGWGLPDIWSSLNYTFDIIDAVEIVHTRPMGTGVLYSNQDGINGAYKEYENIINRYPQKPFKIIRKVYDRPILSIPIIYSNSEEDKKYKVDCLETLPKYAQKILIETINIENKEIYDQEGLPVKEYHLYWKDFNGNKVGKMYFKGDFNFGKARNLLLDICDGIWILSLDIDERLLSHQHEILREWLENPDNHRNVGGYYVTNCSVVTAVKTASGQCQRVVVPMCRLFRNDPDIRYEEGIHEVVDRAILKKGYQIMDTVLWVHHVGYEIEKEKLEKKCLRNIDGLSNPALKEKPEKLDYLINTIELLTNLRRQ